MMPLFRTFPKLLTLGAALTAFAGFAGACSEKSSPPGQACAAGQQIACDCLSGNKGVQICATDGKSYGACQCSSGAGGSSSVGGSSNVGGMLTSGGSGPSGGVGVALGGTSAGGTSAGGAMSGGAAGMAGAGGGPTDCNPIAQSGCLQGERCTWLGAAAPLRLGCVPNGTVALGETCVRAVGADEADNCAAGLRCGDELVCRKICDNATEGSCSANHLCTRTSSTPSPNGGSDPGVCLETCNPVTQVRDTDQAPACGSPNPGTPTRGCYGDIDTGFVCASAGNSANVAGSMPANGSLNSCAPGFQALLRSSSAPQSPIICVAFCAPAPTSSVQPGNAGGLLGSGHTCANRGASGECRYLFLLRDSFVPEPPTSLGNTLGFCFVPSNYQYDSDNDQVLDTPYPSCTTLAPTDVQAPLDGEPDNASGACAPI